MGVSQAPKPKAPHPSPPFKNPSSTTRCKNFLTELIKKALIQWLQQSCSFSSPFLARSLAWEVIARLSYSHSAYPEGHPYFSRFLGKAAEFFYYQMTYSNGFNPMFDTLLTHHPFIQYPAFCSGVLSIFQSLLLVKNKKRDQIGIDVAIKASCPKITE